MKREDRPFLLRGVKSGKERRFLLWLKHRGIRAEIAMNDVRSVRISVFLRNQLKVLARRLSIQQSQRVTIVGLLEEGIDELFRTPLNDLVRWAKEKPNLVSFSVESIPIRVDAVRAEKIGLLAATIQEKSHVPVMIVDLTEEVGRRVINRFKGMGSPVPFDSDREQSLSEKKESVEVNERSKDVSRAKRVNEEAQDSVTPGPAVIMVYNRKGGVGKTSVAGNLAASLAALGFNVAIVDGDDQTNISRLDTRKKARAYLTNVIMETRMGATLYPPAPLLDAMVQVRKRLWLVPSDSSLTTANDHIGSKDEHEILVDRIAGLRGSLKNPPPWRKRFPWFNKPLVTISSFQLEATTEEEYLTAPEYLDFLFFDTPPADNHLTTSMMLASDKILVPVEMDQFSADGLEKVLQGIRKRFHYRTHRAEIIGVLPNKVLHQASDSLTTDFLESVWHHFPELARAPIHHDLTIKNAWAYNQTALEYSRDSRGTRELCALALELVGYEGDMAGLTNCEICEAAVVRSQAPVPVEEA
jgi:chromosome partitioning protein